MKIMIDPGHGGKDPGAVNPRLNLQEAQLTMIYARMLHPVLSDAGHRVMLTRAKEEGPGLVDRVKYAHVFGADCFLSLHCNASTNRAAEGIELWTSPGQTRSDQLATILFTEIKRTFTDRRMRADMEDGDPDREANFYVLRKTRMPAVLLELGFLSNDAEALWLSDFGTVRAYCDAIARGVAAWDPRAIAPG